MPGATPAAGWNAVRDIRSNSTEASTLKSVALMPGFDWETFVDELAMLEKGGFG